MAGELIAAGAVLGAALPFARLHGCIARRRHEIARALPSAIDLLALCMGAGLDLVGALELLVHEWGAGEDTLEAELRHVLQELALGGTRREALLGLAQRVPVPAVRDFAQALIQAELRGAPLTDVVATQAQLRVRRSFAAEETAARASLLLVFPLLLLLAAILLLLVGPLLVGGVHL